MNHKYIAQLTDEEREALRALVQKGQTQGYRIKHAQILMKLDEIPESQEWTYDQIKEAHHATPHTISQIAKRFITGGMEAALGRKEQVYHFTNRKNGTLMPKPPCNGSHRVRRARRLQANVRIYIAKRFKAV